MDSRPSFDEVLSQAIDDALTSIGEKPKNAIYFHLEKDHALSRKEIPRRIADFSEALDKIFGFGARNLEILFMKHLHERIRDLYDVAAGDWLVPQLTFEQYVDSMRMSFEKAAKKEEVVVEFLINEREEREQIKKQDS